MSTDETAPEFEWWSQLSLLAEPEATLAIRVTAVRGDPLVTLSFTITRPDDSWLACRVKTSVAGGEAIRTALAELVDESVPLVLEAVYA